MNKLPEKISILILSCVILAFSVFSFIIPDKPISDKENRALTQMPKFTFEKLFSGEFTNLLGEYTADQFPLRDMFVGVKAYTELCLFKNENNGIVYTQNALIPRPVNNISRLTDNLDCIESFAERLKLNVTIAPIPRVADVFVEYLPSAYPTQDDFSVWENLRLETKNRNFNTVDLYDLLCESNAYYKTDHHFTSHGAYLTYNALADSLGYVPYNQDYFEVESVSKDFAGTSMRSSGFYLYDRDEIVLYRYDGDSDYDVAADGKKIALYDFSKLDSTDKYALFLGGNHARVDIKNGEDREKLLVIRDSFADSLVPFLALHFDVTLIDLRYFTKSVAQICEQENINKILVLENADEFCSTKTFSYLRME